MRAITAATIFTLFLSILIVTPAAPAGKPIVIRFSHAAATNSPKGQMANKFKELIEKQLPGKVVVDIFPQGEQFSDNSVLAAILLGDIQMAAPSLANFTRYDKKMQLFDLPFLFTDMEAVERFENSPEGRQLLDSLRPKGLLGLGYLHNGFKVIAAHKPVKVPEDVEGLRFRIQPSDVLAAQFRVLKAIPLKSSSAPILPMLQDQAVDAQEITWSDIYSRKFFTRQSYITESEHGLVDELVVTSVAFWQTLPTDIRNRVQQALDEAIRFGNSVAADKSIADRQKIIDSGYVRIITLNSEEKRRWRQALLPLNQEFVDEIGAELLEAASRANTTETTAKSVAAHTMSQ